MHLPQEILTSILVRLPAKSLSCFKCVCKTWCDIIDNPSFMNQRLKTLNNVSSNDPLYLIYPELAPGPTTMFLLCDADKEIKDLNGAPCIIIKHNTQRPTFLCPTITGPINGIYCIITDLTGYAGVRLYPNIVFWNPGTGQVHILPPIPCPVIPHDLSSDMFDNPSRFHRFSGGFGYDPSSKDYKFVSISEYGDKFSSPSHNFALFHIYNLASNSWHELDPHQIAYPSLITCEDDGRATLKPTLYRNAFPFSNACHWIYDSYEGTCEEPEVQMISFDIVNHVFRVTCISKTVPGEWSSTLTTINGCLGVVSKVYDGVSNRGFNIAVMKEYGVEESWTMAYKIRMNTPSKFIGIVGDVLFFQEEDGLTVSSCVGEHREECREYCHVPFKNATILPFEGSLVSVKPRMDHDGRN